jgi:hypothetical protein
MKKVEKLFNPKQVLQKVRNRLRPEEAYFTFSHWDPKIIDGVTFLPVVLSDPSFHQTQSIRYMRKDSLEYFK